MVAPRIRVRDTAGTLRTLTRIRARDTGGTLRTITRIRVRDANNVLRIVWDPTGASTLSASASPDLVSASGTSGSMTTDTTVVTASNGTAPYTYAWTLIDHDGPVPPTATAPTSASSEFTQTSIGPGAAYSSTWRCTVTDAASNTATADITAIWVDIT